jgi:hypothetical protein
MCSTWKLVAIPVESAIFAVSEDIMKDHWWFYFFVTSTCSFLVLERLVQVGLEIRRFLERRSARISGDEYAMLRADEAERDPELFSWTPDQVVNN